MHPSATGTAHFLAYVGDMFDSVNDSEEIERDGKELRAKVTKDTAHVLFWKSAIPNVQSWQFLDGRGIVGQKPPSQEGWLFTLRGIQILWEILNQQDDFPGDSVPRNLNQDPLENLFGCIRGQRGSNHNPTVEQFIAGLKTCIINGLLIRGTVKGMNCEVDDATLLTDLQTFLSSDYNESTLNEGEVIEEEVHQAPAPLPDEDPEPDTESSVTSISATYLSASIAREICRVSSCDSCKAGLCSSNPVQLINSGVDQEGAVAGGIITLSENLVKAVCKSVTVIEEWLGMYAHTDGVLRGIHQVITEEVNFTFLRQSCAQHHSDVLKTIVSELGRKLLRNWCTRKNKQLLYFK